MRLVDIFEVIGTLVGIMLLTIVMTAIGVLGFAVLYKIGLLTWHLIV